MHFSHDRADLLHGRVAQPRQACRQKAAPLHRHLLGGGRELSQEWARVMSWLGSRRGRPRRKRGVELPGPLEINNLGVCLDASCLRIKTSLAVMLLL